MAIDQRVVLPNCIREATKAHIRSCFLKRIYAPSHLWRGWRPKDVQQSHNNPAAVVTEQKGKDREDERETIYALGSKMNGFESG